MSNSPSARPPAFLASVKNASEACEAFAAGADIIDCKDPARGALGKLDTPEIASVVSAIAHLVPVSATIGDDFADIESACCAAREVAAAGVQIVKCGFFGASHDAAVASMLAKCDLGKAHLFAVLMADRVEDFSLLPHLAQAGFIGVMLDTADKSSGSLSRVMDLGRIADFLAKARGLHLAAGLAGSLAESDIGPLAALAPDILGFRGALCQEGRNGALDERRVESVRRTIDQAAGAARQRSVA